MCYSAEVWADYREFVRAFEAAIDIHAFYKLYWRPGNPDTPGKTRRPRTAKAMDDAFLHARTDEERRIAALIGEERTEQQTELEQRLFSLRKRLADAERILQTKPTKKAGENKRIATDKIAWAMGKLGDLHRTEAKPRDRRIFPGWYVPVMLWEDGQRIVRPMRYQCRPADKPAFYDAKYPGTYNARRDNLEKFWKGQFGHTHAVMAVTAFYENVSRHTMEHRELAAGEAGENVVLEFRPRPAQTMFIACLYSNWVGPDEDLWSFAAITDDPPPEVAAAGHDRCIIQIQPEHIDAWLRPDSTDRAALYRILDDRPRPFYEHRAAA